MALLDTFDILHCATAFFDLDHSVEWSVHVPDPVNTLAKRGLVRFTTELLARDALGTNAIAGYSCYHNAPLRRITAAFKRDMA